MVSAAVACLPAAVSLLLLAALFMQISGVNLALTWPPQALFTQSSPVREPLLQAFPFPSTLGEVTLLLLSQACVFVYSSHGRLVFPPLLWSFSPSATLTSFPTPGCWAHAPAPSSLACLFTVPGRITFPQSLVLSAPHPLSHMSLVFLLLITLFLFFPQVEVGLSRGLC
jgi:hypothetical protein